MRKKRWAQLLSATLTVSCVFTGGGAAFVSAQAGQDAGPSTVEEEYGEFFSTEEGQPEQAEFYGSEPEESFFDIEAEQPEQAGFYEPEPEEGNFFNAEEEQADFTESELEEEILFDIEADEEKGPEDSDIFQESQEDVGELFLPENEELLAAADGSVPLDQAHFPDKNFLKIISNEYDADGDGILSAKEIRGIWELAVGSEDISSLKGIEYFTELEDLYCWRNNLTELDVSRNTQLTTIICHTNNLTKLDVSKNTKLTDLDCSNNKLAELDVSKNTQLTTLLCYTNNLTELDVSKNTQLTDLQCEENHLTYLNLEGIPLTGLYCGHEEYLDYQTREVELDPSAPQVSLTDLVGRENLGRITLEEGYEMDESGVVSSAKFAPGTFPDQLVYHYDTGFNGIKMDVLIFLHMPSSSDTDHSTRENALLMELEREYTIASADDFESYFLKFCPQDKETYYLQMDSLDSVILYAKSGDYEYKQEIRADSSEEIRKISGDPGDVFYIEVDRYSIETSGTLSILNYKKYLTEKYEARENLPVFQNTDLNVVEKELLLKDFMDDQGQGYNGEIPLKIIPTRTGRYLLALNSFIDSYYITGCWDSDYQDIEVYGYESRCVYLEKGRTYYARLHLWGNPSDKVDESAVVKLSLVWAEDVAYGTEGALSRTVLYKGLDCYGSSYRFPEIYLKGSLEVYGDRVVNEAGHTHTGNETMMNGDRVQWMLTANGTSSELPSQTGTYQAQFVITNPLTQEQKVIDVGTVQLAEPAELPLVKGSGTVQPVINYWGDAFFRLQTGTAAQYSIHNPYSELSQQLWGDMAGDFCQIDIFEKEIAYPWDNPVQSRSGADPVFTLAPNTTYYVRVYNPTCSSLRETILTSMNVTVKALGKKSLKDCTVTVASSAAYTGKAVTPAVKVKDGSVTLKKGTDYTLKFVNNKNLGTATVTVTGKGNYKEAVKKTFKIVLAVPKLVSVKSAGYNSLKVTWGKVTGASSYNLYYKKAGAKNWTLVKSGIKTVSYTHTSSKLLTGTKYAYTVRAVKGKNTSGYNKNGLSAAPSLAAGKLTKVAKTSNGLKLTWSKVTGASGYVIERMQNGKWVTKKTISGGSKVSFVDTTAAKGKTFRYRIRAFRTVNGKKVYGAYSPAKGGKR